MALRIQLAVFLQLALAALAQQPDWAKEGKIETVEVGSAPASTAFAGRVYFAGQPSAEDLAAYARLGVRTVINLRTPEEMEKVGFTEAAVVEKEGMRYVNVPFGAEPPQGAALGELFAALGEASQGKVLLHCASSNRAGFIWGLYRASAHGLSPETALAEAQAAGMKSPALQKRLREQLEKN